MKNITSNYKTNVKNFGRQIDSKISYTIEGTTTELGKEQLNSVTPHYESSILKSAMKQLDIDSNVDIPLNTTLNYQFGVLVNNEYEYINYGNYVVYSSEKQEDTNSYKIVCYDKMLYSMVDYTKMNITYPITIRNYIQAICDTIGLNFKNANDEFVNYDKLIQNELYFDAQDKSLGYKFRDVLDELAQVTGSTICINEETDELEIRYINEGVTYEEAEGTTIDLEDSIKHKLSNPELKGNTTQQTYTGKNLLKNTNVNSGDNNHWQNYSTFDQTTGTLTRSTTSTSEATIIHRYNLKNNTTYTISCLAKSNGYVKSFQIYAISSDFSKIYNTPYINITTSYTKQSLTFTTDSSTDYTNSFIRFDNDGSTTSGTTATLTITDVMLVEGTNTDFEPYVGGIPSPNPDYPQPVNNVTGRQEIDVVGKNLCNITSEQRLHYSSGLPTDSSDTIVIDNYDSNNVSFHTTSANYNIVLSNIIQLQPNTTYTIKFDRTTTSTNNQWFIYDYNGSYSINFRDNNTNVLEKTFTTNNVGKIALAFGHGNTTGQTEISNIQIEKGETATEYEPYIGKQYEINLGKNLLCMENGTYSKNGITAVVENGEITLNGTASGNAFVNIQLGEQLNWKNGEKYTISAFNEVENSSLRIRITTSGTFDTTLNLANKTQTITYNGVQDILSSQIAIRVENGTTLNNFKFKPMIEVGSQSTSYSLYFTPIELCKIGDYQDYIRKSTGKNLFDINNANILKGWLDNNKMALSPTQYNRLFYIPCKTNTTYTISRSILTGTFRVATYDSEPFPTMGTSEVQYNVSGLIKDNNATNITITTGSNAKYLVVHYGRIETDPNIEDSLNTIQIEESSTATEYEPYGKVWYIHKEIGKFVLNGSEKWSYSSGNVVFYTDAIATLHLSKLGTSFYSNNFNWIDNSTSFANMINGNGKYQDNTSRRLILKNTNYTNANDFKTWLGTHNTDIYYILNTPTDAEITDTELINQLEALNNAKTYDGITHITVDGDLPSTLKISYANGYDLDTINEEYFKDINVNFGEKYGPINSIVLSRSAGADNVYLRDEESIAEDGLHELKISDNQIMNFNDRSDYLPDLLKQLGGLEYYLNDYASTGITYYEMCDRYFAQIGDTKYSCVMFNDEVLVTQGLVENIHTDMPEETETDYSKADKTDRKINQTNLIVNKQTGDIEALTTKTEEIEEDLSENYYTKTMTNQLIQNAETGVTNTFSEAGGNNILRNTNFSATEVLETGQEYEYWYGNVVKTSNNNSANGMSILLQNGNLYQEQQVANGTYTVSFYYKKLNPLATGKLVVNGIEYNLTEDDYTLFQTGLKDEVGAYITTPVVVNDNHLRVQFTSDTNNAFEVYDIMCNFGTVKLAYSQNQNETITNTVNISKGITITASDKDVKFVATPDGIRIKNKDTDEIITDFTDKGMDTKNAIIEESATIVGIYRQKVGDQVWDSLM